jgi:hypothetical protein
MVPARRPSTPADVLLSLTQDPKAKQDKQDKDVA